MEKWKSACQLSFFFFFLSKRRILRERGLLFKNRPSIQSTIEIVTLSFPVFFSPSSMHFFSLTRCKEEGGGGEKKKKTQRNERLPASDFLFPLWHSVLLFFSLHELVAFSHPLPGLASEPTELCKLHSFELKKKKEIIKSSLSTPEVTATWHSRFLYTHTYVRWRFCLKRDSGLSGSEI